MTSHGRRNLIAGAAIAATLLVGAACGGTKTDDSIEKDFSISLANSSLKSGDVTFSIKNEGPSVHEFVVIKTAQASGALPTKEENGVKVADEDASGLEAVDEVEDIANGSTQTLMVHLTPGHYVVICNIAGHYEAGMHTDITVS